MKLSQVYCICPASILDESTILPINATSIFPDCRIMATYLSLSGEISPSFGLAMSSAKPMMEAMGLLRSWVMAATKSSFIRFNSHCLVLSRNTSTIPRSSPFSSTTREQDTSTRMRCPSFLRIQTSSAVIFLFSSAAALRGHRDSQRVFPSLSV